MQAAAGKSLLLIVLCAWLSVSCVLDFLCTWQVFKGLHVDPVTGDMLLKYRLPQGAVAIGAHLTAKLLLVQPGVNGEPDWQHFELSELLPGKDGPCKRCAP